MPQLIAFTTVVLISTLHHSIMGHFGDTPALEAQRLMVCAFSLVLAQWCLDDAKARRFHRPYEFGAFIFFIWPFVLPAYLIRTRGWKGVPVFIGFLVLAWLPGACGWLAFYLGPAYEAYGG